MKAFYIISTVLFVFVLDATNIDLCIKKMFSKNISIEYNDSEAAENDKEEKESEEDDLNELASIQYKLTQNLIQSKLYVIAALVKLEQPTILLEFPPPNI